MLNTISFSTTDGGMLVCVKPPKINLNKTAIWQKCKSLCSLRLHFLSSGHPGNHRPSSFQKPSLRLDIHPEYILVFFITSDMHIECKSVPKMKGTSNAWRDTQTGIISSSTYFAVQIFLKYLSEFARIFLCVTDGMLWTQTAACYSQAFTLSLTKTNYG